MFLTECQAQAPDGVMLAWRDLPARAPDPGLPVLCMHGLTRQSGDFETVFDWLTEHHRVIAPDFRGRGRSAPATDLAQYNPLQYAHDTLSILARLGIERAIVIGTSLGGWVAAQMAALRPDLFCGVVLNDIGPEIPSAAAGRVESRAGSLVPVSTWDDAIDATRDHYAHALGDVDTDTWRWYAQQTYREIAPGNIDLWCDRGVGEAARAGLSWPTRDPWALFDALCCRPTLVVRGASSDILTADTLAKMHGRYPGLASVIVPNRGHVPLLNEPEVQRALCSFIDELDPPTESRNPARSLADRGHVAPGLR